MYQYKLSTYEDELDLNSTEFRRPHAIGWAGKGACAAFVLISIFYFSYRLPLWNPAAPVLSGLLLAAETFGVLTLALHVFSTWTLIERSAPPPPAEFCADILITTWNESPHLLRQTLLAAKQVRRAQNVWLLDDGCRPAMEQLAIELGVRYIARADRSHAKAGNLNNALRHSNAEFIAVFDCDHAPSPEFLERTLGHFLDPGVAFVQTPQDFYNLDSFQHRGSARTREAWHEQTLFYRVIQAGKDRWNATFFCGSCAILRRAALEDIGGFATGTITEDMHTSLRMHKNGWKAAYHAEALAFGLSPVNLEQYETQRLRWGRGAMQVWAKEGILLARDLTIAQRLAYFTSAVTYFEGWQKAIIYFLPMVVLVTGSMPLIWTGWPFVLIFSLWMLSGLLVSELFSRGYAKTLWMEEYNFIRFFTFIKATVTLLIPQTLRFMVTPKRMQKHDFWDVVRLWPQLLMLLCAIVSGVIGSYLYWTTSHLPQGAFAANLFWLMLNAILAIKALTFVMGKMSQRRSDHRFLLPLVARVSLNDNGAIETFTAIAEDVSSDGLSLAVDREVSPHSEISGTLLLPTGPLGFRGTVQRCTRAGASAYNVVGVSLEWAHSSEADPLSLYLHGNALQWDVNAWDEVSTYSPTIDSLLRAFRKTAPAGPWALARVTGAGQAIDCLARGDGERIRLLSHAPLPATAALTVSQADKNEVTGLLVVGYREYAVGEATVYLAVLAQKLAHTGGFHREPAWVRAQEF